MAFPLISVAQFFDSSGSPLANGTIEFRNPSDDTYINTYPTAADADAQTNANANPLTLNARGEAATGIYLEDGVKYKVVLREPWPDELTPGNIVWTQDNVLCPIGLPYAQTAAESAAGVTPTNVEYPPGNVLRYGTNTTPGTTDMTTAISNAINSGEKEIYIPAGVYLVSSMIVLPTGITIRGSGATATEIRVDNSVYPWAQGVFSTIDTTSSAGAAAYRWGTGTINKYDIHISGIRFNLDRSGLSTANATASNAFAIRFEDARDCRITNCHFVDSFDSASTDNGYQCINLVRTENCKIDNCNFNGITGVLAQDTAYTQVIKNTFEGSVGSCIDLAVGTYASVLDNDVIDGTVWSVSSIGVNCDYSTVKGNRITGATLTGITLGETTLDNYSLDPSCDYTVCEGNVINGGSGDIGILLQAANGSTITGNVIKDIGTTGLGATVDFTAGAISARASAVDNIEDITITGNVCTNVCRGINLGNNGYSTISNNVIKLWAVLNGSHDGSGNAEVLSDSTQSWPVDALIGWTLTNVTDGSSTTVTANTATTITGVLSGGTDDDWDASDRYYLRLGGTGNFQEGINATTGAAPASGMYSINGNTIVGGEIGIYIQGDNVVCTGNSIEKTSNYPVRLEDYHAVFSGNRMSECDRECSIFQVTACAITNNIFYHSDASAVAIAYRVTGDGTSADVSWETATVVGNVNIGATSDVVFTNVNNAPANPTTLTRGLLAQNARGTYSLEDLPTGSGGLSTGDLWSNSGVVTIA